MQLQQELERQDYIYVLSGLIQIHLVLHILFKTLTNYPIWLESVLPLGTHCPVHYLRIETPVLKDIHTFGDLFVVFE